jgi:hypothetical protein
VEQLVDAMPDKYKAMVLVGAYAGLRWGEAAGLTRASIGVLTSRITIASTAVEVRGHYVGPEPDALVFMAPQGGPLARSLFSRRV